jgi:inosine triphosphate pyrophosphatase
MRPELLHWNTPLYRRPWRSDGITWSRWLCLSLGIATTTTRAFSGPTKQYLWHHPPCTDRAGSSHHALDATSRTPITFVTGNVNKLREVQQILSLDDQDFPFEIINQSLDDLPECQGSDAIAIAVQKCRAAADLLPPGRSNNRNFTPLFIEDTSLCFTALGGLPGPYIKWFLEKCGHDGLHRMLVGFDDFSAHAETVIAFMMVDHGHEMQSSMDNVFDNGFHDQVHVFTGRTYGTIVSPPRGPLQFGWDPIFQPVDEIGQNLTYAEMDKKMKNQISHRSRAFAEFRSFLIEHQHKIRSD